LLVVLVLSYNESKETPVFETLWVLAIATLLGIALLGFSRACSRERLSFWEGAARLCLVLAILFVLARVAGSLVAGG
jgi:hypothetical protein